MNTNVHEGKRLKWWISTSSKDVKDICSEMNFKTYGNLYYYYPQQRIKLDMLQKFCKVLNITVDEFYSKKTDNANEEKVSTHQGINLESAIASSGITDTAFAGKLKISRNTLYKLYKKKQLDEDLILKAAGILKLPVASLKGIGIKETDKSFENDIYIALRSIDSRLSKIETALANSAK